LLLFISRFPFLLFAFDYFFVAREENKQWRKTMLKQHSPFFVLAGAHLYLHYSFQKPDILYALKDTLVWRDRPDFLSNLLTQCLLGGKRKALAHFEEGIKFPSARFRQRGIVRIVKDLQRRVGQRQREQK
jgi:hypothetical protein